MNGYCCANSGSGGHGGRKVLRRVMEGWMGCSIAGIGIGVVLCDGMVGKFCGRGKVEG